MDTIVQINILPDTSNVKSTRDILSHIYIEKYISRKGNYNSAIEISHSGITLHDNTETASETLVRTHPRFSNNYHR